MSRILEVENLRVAFATAGGETPVVKGIDLALDAGEVLGLVGESGSGKSVTSMVIAGLLDETRVRVESDALVFDGRELSGLPPAERRRVNGAGIGIVTQDALSALNPVLTIAKQFGLVLQTHLGLRGAAARRRARDLLEAVEVPDPDRRLDDYPHQLSGGQRQRVLIALALAANPRVLIADEPTTALDVTVQAQIVRLVGRLAAEHGTAVIWVTHDLGVVSGLADRVAVMRSGRILEHGAPGELFSAPQHPYTRRLIDAIPRIPEPRRRLSRGRGGGWLDGHTGAAGCPGGGSDCLLTVAAIPGAPHTAACFTTYQEEER